MPALVEGVGLLPFSMSLIVHSVCCGGRSYTGSDLHGSTTDSTDDGSDEEGEGFDGPSSPMMARPAPAVKRAVALPTLQLGKIPSANPPPLSRSGGGLAPAKAHHPS